MLWGIGVDLLMSLLVGIFLLVSMVLSSAVTFLHSYQGPIRAISGPIIQWAIKFLIPLFFSYCMFFLIYKVIPNRKIHLKSAFQAALLAGLLWELAKHLFSWYVVHVANYSVLYGSLSTLVIFVLWVHYSSTILIVGGELIYLMEEDRRRAMA